MTTDKIEVKDDIDATNADRKRTPKPEPDSVLGGPRQPLQAQQRVERENPGPDVTTAAGVGLPVGNKGKSPGNGG